MKQPTSIEEMADGGIDAGLTMLALSAEDGRTYSQEEIAEVCGCSRQLIYYLEQRALRKLRRGFKSRGIDAEYLVRRS
jgi:DNA-directed RNA polymerase sigma subunit (sigma70/sigma32)